MKYSKLLPPKKTNQHKNNFIKLPKAMLRLNNRAIVIVLVAVIGTGALLLTKAATYSVSVEPESGALSNGATKISGDSTASGQSFVQFGALSPSPGGVMPTRNNTGPRYSLTNMSASDFLNTRTCNKQRISDRVVIEDSIHKGKTFNITDCEINSIWVAFGNTTPLALNEQPIINIDYSYFTYEFVTGSAAQMTMNHSWVNDGASQFKTTNAWLSTSPGVFPLKVMNSVFVEKYITQPAHSEALQTSDDNYTTGMRFINTVFMVEAGPLQNTGISATVNFHGIDAVFDGCYFLWDGEPPVPAYYSAIFMGTDITVKNSWFEKGQGGYIDTQGYQITNINNKDISTKELITGSTAL